MKSIFQKISAFFMSVIMSILALFGISPHSELFCGEWLLEGVPPFEAGVYSSALYNTGTGLDQEMPTTDTPEPHPALSKMQLITHTTLPDVNAYCETLSMWGYTQTFHNRIEDNYFFGYSDGEKNVYFYFNEKNGETRVIDDCCNTASYDAFNSSVEIDPEKAAQPGVYQFSYPYADADHTDSTLYESSGMLYIIVLSDKRVILIDGGAIKQSTDQNVAELWRVLHKVTGKKKDTRIKIALWYGTHNHSDHTNLFFKLLHDYHKKIDLERVMFNYQSDEVIEKQANVINLRRVVNRRYPNVSYLKVRSGFRFQLQDADCQVLYTQEDAVNAADAATSVTNPNDFSAVLRVTLGEKVFLFLGDSNLKVEQALLQKFSPAVLRADVLQAAHHVYNDLSSLYQAVLPTLVMCPQSRLRAVSGPLPAYLTLRSLVSDENLFFAGENLVYGFIPQPDGSIATKKIKVKCGAYDGTFLPKTEPQPEESEIESGSVTEP